MSTYIIFQNQVLDRENMAQYIPEAMKLIYSSGGEVIVFEEESEILEGPKDLPRTIVLRFNSRQEAESWYSSPAYQEILALRLKATIGTARMVDEYVANDGE